MPRLGHLAFLFAWCGLLQAQTPKVESFSIEQGLSHRQVNGMVKDRQGFIWIATSKGLNRFDGYSFLTYDARPRNPHSIRKNNIFSLMLDQAGKLLIIYDSEQQGDWDLLDPKTGQVTPLIFDEGAGFHGQYIASFQAQDGSLYFLKNVEEEHKVELYRYEAARPGFTKVFETRDIDRPHYVVRFQKAEDGTFWLVYRGGSGGQPGLWIVHTDASGKTLRSYKIDFPYQLSDAMSTNWGITQTPEGEILVVPNEHGVFSLHPDRDDVFRRHTHLPENISGFAKDKKGNLLVYRYQSSDPTQGCYLYTTTGQVLDYSWIYAHQSIIRRVYSEDFTAGFMAGSGNGFNNYQLSSERFETFLDKDLGTAPYGISIRGMAKLNRDKLFIATERDGLYELDLHTRALSRTGDRLPQLDSLNQFQFYRNLLPQGDTALWICGTDRVHKYLPAQNRLISYKTLPDARSKAKDDLWGMVLGKDGDLWIAARSGRILILDPVSGAMKTYYNADGSQPLEKVQPSFILKGSDGTIWVGTTLAGLVKIDPDKRESKRYSADADDPSGFTSNHINCIYEDPAGLLWVGTMETGVHVFDPKKGRVQAIYSRENGLRNNSTVGILPDGRGNYWVSTFSGLSYLDTQSKTFSNYTTADGLSHDEFNRYAYFFDPDYGRFYFGGMNGVNAFDQINPQSTANDAPVLISEMSITGRNDQVLVRNEGLEDGTTITLAPGSRFLRLQLALASYRNPGGNQFSYKIEGLDKDWNYLGANHELRINSLPVGNYVLHLRGADDRGNWSSKQIALHLVVQEYWYRRWWAYLLYAGLLLAGAYYFYRFQLSRRLAEKEAQRLSQLDAFKTRFFTNISHEFRTPLTVILGMVGALKKDAKPEQEQAAEMVRRNSQQLLSLVNQLLDLSRLEAGKLELSPANGDLANYLKYQLESFQSYAQARDIGLHFYSDVPRLEMAFDQEKIQTILVNLISNALKFTPEGGRIDLELQTGPAAAGAVPEKITVVVRDTGIGIPEDQQGLIFDRFYQADDSTTRKGEGTGIGLALVQELVKLMQGTITVESRPGRGTAFRITLPYVPPVPQGPTAAALPTLPGVPILSQSLEADNSAADDARPLLLIVEDSPDVRFYIAECVKSEYRIALAANGAEGIAKAIELVPDLIVSDVMMPEKDGFELCATLKNDERSSHIPIVLLTARADFESRIAGLKRGADDYLAKPFEPEELQVRLGNLLQLRRRLQQRYAGLPQLPAPDQDQDPALVLEDAFLLRIREVVEAHLSDSEFEMPQLERALGMSRSQVFRKVKALTGESPSVLIRSIRLHKSLELLRDSRLTIAEVAYEVGFSTPNYFATTFLEAFGKTPSEWRQS